MMVSTQSVVVLVFQWGQAFNYAQLFSISLLQLSSVHIHLSLEVMKCMEDHHLAVRVEDAFVLMMMERLEGYLRMGTAMKLLHNIDKIKDIITYKNYIYLLIKFIKIY